MRFFATFLLLLTPLGASDLIPNPRQITPAEGQLLIDVQTAVIAAADLADHAKVISLAVQKTTGFLHRIRTPQQVGNMKFNRPIKLSLANISDKPGFYRIEIIPTGITLTATDRNGLMHGAQTIANLLPVSKTPKQRAFLDAQTIEDWPHTPRRIFHLNVGAHLFPTDDLKSLIDWLSFHKINELHLQFNNDHGWRLESPGLPKLHEIGSIRTSTPPYGDRTGSDSTEYRGYYTHANIRELLAHAQSRAVTLIPAFSLTTGASAIIASYPELGKNPTPVANTWEPRTTSIIDSEKSLTFLDTLFAETAALFPSSEIRIEGPVTSLHPKIKTLLEKHRRMPLLPSSLATTDFSLYQRPPADELLFTPKREAAGGFNPVARVYQIQPTPAGAEATLDTEFVHDFEKLQYLVFPRLAAFAEATWLPETQLNYENFRTRLTHLDARYRLAGVSAAVAYDPPVASALHNTIVTTTLRARENHSPELAFDGSPRTFFWSADGLREGDHLTFEFPWSATGEITVTTGINGTTEGILEDGFLELSEDGKSWHTSEPFIAGKATATARKPTRFLRLRASVPQKTSLVLEEVSLAEPLLAPLHRESRVIQLPVTKKNVSLTFEADFTKHPELREKFHKARRTYFDQWLPLALRLGVAHHPATPLTLKIDSATVPPGDFASWMNLQMILHLQHYPAITPSWFRTGFTSFLLADFPEKTDRSKPLEGGSQTAAFLQWLAKTYDESILTAISRDFHFSEYRPSIWKSFTQKSLDDLVRDYQTSR